jgi:hypothetical protein
MLVIRSARKRLDKAVASELEHLHLELASLSKSGAELEADLEELRKKKSRESDRLKSLNEQTTAYKDELDVFLKAQGPLIEQDLKNLQSVVRQRLLDDVRYSLEKEKKVPSPSRIRDIVEKGLRYGLIDIVRDHRHRLNARLHKIEEVLYGHYPEYFETSAKDRDSFDHAHEKGFLVTNNEVLISRLTRLLAKSSLKTLLKDDKKMAEVIQEAFVHLENFIKNRALEVSQLLLDGLFGRINHSIEGLLKRLDTHEALLQVCLSSIGEDEALRAQRSLELHKRAKRIELIAKRSQG